jgi:hypothetical protein
MASRHPTFYNARLVLRAFLSVQSSTNLLPIIRSPSYSNLHTHPSQDPLSLPRLLRANPPHALPNDSSSSSSPSQRTHPHSLTISILRRTSFEGCGHPGGCGMGRGSGLDGVEGIGGRSGKDLVETWVRLIRSRGMPTGVRTNNVKAL